MVATLASSTIRAAESHSLDRTLEPYLREFALPALAAAVFKEGVVIASGVTGTRRAGERIPVRIDDRFHIGSDALDWGDALGRGHALGWGQVMEDWAPEPVITHTGSNTMTLATAMFWPGLKVGAQVVETVESMGSSVRWR